MQKLKVLDLFSGIGGFSLGLEKTGGFETIAFCEIDPFCQKVLRKHWPNVPIVSDIRKLSYDQKTQELKYDGEIIYVGTIDIITGGFPCQPFSVAGKQKGHEDDRHLWPVMFSLIEQCRPTWIIGENVAGFINMALDDVLANLESADYTPRTFVIPACAKDAPHRRDRVFIVAHSDSLRKSSGSKKRNIARNRLIDRSEIIPNTNIKYAQRQQPCITDPQERQRPNKRQTRPQDTIARRFWPVEPAICRVAYGIPNRVDRLKSLGNSVVMQIITELGYAILAAMETQNE